MTRILNVNLKKFMGANYERGPKTLLLWAIVFVSLRLAEIRIEIAPLVVCLTTLFVTVSGFVGVLSSDDIADSMRGQLMLPESPLKFHMAFFLSVVLYTFLTKAGLLLIGYLALSPIRIPAILGFFVCFFGSGVVVYPLAFQSEKNPTANRCVGGVGHHFITYLLRYLWNHKNYLVNTAALWTFGCIFSAWMSQVDFPNLSPLGFALMCLNTPLGTLLSSDRALYRQVLFLPGQAWEVLFPYALLVATVNGTACTVYLLAWHLTTARITPMMVWLAMGFSMTSAALTVWLETAYPLLAWKVESDLWHHPRKYIVPGSLVVLALISIVLMGGF